MRRAGVLGELGDEQLRLLAFGAEHLNFRPRQPIWRAGEEAQGAALVLAGRVELVRPSGAALDALAGVGTLLDEVAMFVPTTRRFTATAQVTTELILIPRTHMDRLLSEFPEAATGLRNRLADRLTALLEDLDGLDRPGPGG